MNAANVRGSQPTDPTEREDPMTTKAKLMIAAAAMSGLLAGSAARSIASVSVTPSHESSIKPKKVIADDTGKKDADKADKHDCKGKNDCKGKGGCKTSDNGCKGKNSCKGKGGCATNKDDKSTDKKVGLLRA